MYSTTHNEQQHIFYRCLLCNIVFVVQYVYIYTNSYTQYLYVYLYHKYHQTWNNVFHSWSILSVCERSVCALCTLYMRCTWVNSIYMGILSFLCMVLRCTTVPTSPQYGLVYKVCTYVVCMCVRVIWVLVCVCVRFDWLCVWKCWESTL